jgi:cytochrome c biogenesis protein CcmG/thiol:disulfide interchange protein DsbE
MKQLAALIALTCACAPMRTLPHAQVKTMDGAPLRLDELRGPLLLDIWATWCVPCEVALPFYARLHEQTGIRVIAMSIDSSPDDVRQWMREHRVPFEMAIDPNGAVAERMGMRMMPTMFLLDARGQIFARHDGFQPADQPRIESEVRQLLKIKREAREEREGSRPP